MDFADDLFIDGAVDLSGLDWKHTFNEGACVWSSDFKIQTTKIFLHSYLCLNITNQKNQLIMIVGAETVLRDFLNGIRQWQAGKPKP